MKITYIGNFSQAHCTEVHLAYTLTNMGHEVIELQENELEPGWVDVVPDDTNLVLYTRTWGQYVTLDDLAKLRDRKIITASYHLDLYIGLSRKYLHEGKTLEEILKTDPFWRTDFVFTPDSDPESQEIFKDNGVNHHYIKAGVFGPECYLEEERGGGADVLFVGGGDRPGSPTVYGHPEWNYRNELIAWLYDTYGDRFTKKGHPQETVRNHELNRLYADSKVVIGDSVCINFEHSNYWSDRVYETLGRGGFLIHPYIKGMEEEFTDGKHLVFYKFGDFDDLKKKIDYFIENEWQRETIRLTGHEFVKNNCTYDKRLEQALAIIFGAEEFVSSTDSSATFPIKINLGAGSEPTKGWVNVDWIDGPGIDVVHNLLEFPWPFEDGAADEMLARDVLEHMPLFNKENQSTPIKFIEECHRILEPGGKLFITVPHWQSKNLWIDPTHVRGYDEKSFDYFDPDTDFGKWYGYYSDKKFKVSAVRTENDNVEFTMVKI